MPKAICVNCQVEYDIEKSGVYVVEYFSDPPKPYKLWSADLYSCPICGDETITAFGLSPIREHYQDGFDELMAKAEESGKIYKCYEAGHLPA